MFLVSSRSCLRSIHWSQVLSWEWKCSWSSADSRCSNYIWVINNFIAYEGATYIRGFTVGPIDTTIIGQALIFQPFYEQYFNPFLAPEWWVKLQESHFNTPIACWSLLFSVYNHALVSVLSHRQYRSASIPSTRASALSISVKLVNGGVK